MIPYLDSKILELEVLDVPGVLLALLHNLPFCLVISSAFSASTVAELCSSSTSMPLPTPAPQSAQTLALASFVLLGGTCILGSRHWTGGCNSVLLRGCLCFKRQALDGTTYGVCKHAEMHVK